MLYVLDPYRCVYTCLKGVCVLPDISVNSYGYRCVLPVHTDTQTSGNARVQIHVMGICICKCVVEGAHVHEYMLVRMDHMCSVNLDVCSEGCVTAVACGRSPGLESPGLIADNEPRSPGCSDKLSYDCGPQSPICKMGISPPGLKPWTGISHSAQTRKDSKLNVEE